MSIKEAGQLTVYFDEPFWVGVFESICEGKISTCRVVFGAEPKDYAIYEFILGNYDKLKFSKPMPIDQEVFKRNRINPKRMQRQIKKQTNPIGIGTKAQQALKKEYESNKTERKRVNKEKKNLDKQLKYTKKQEKKKSKKRGH